MKLNLALIVAATSAFAAAAPAPAGSSKSTCSNSYTNEVLFDRSISSFEKSRKAGLKKGKAAACDWSSDDCSGPAVENPLGFNFEPSCHRHDFGYRNVKDQDRFTEKNRKNIDDNFKRDMYDVCDKYDGLESFKGVACRRVADTYYFFVRKCGNGGCPGS